MNEIRESRSFCYNWILGPTGQGWRCLWVYAKDDVACEFMPGMTLLVSLCQGWQENFKSITLSSSRKRGSMLRWNYVWIPIFMGMTYANYLSNLPGITCTGMTWGKLLGMMCKDKTTNIYPYRIFLIYWTLLECMYFIIFSGRRRGGSCRGRFFSSEVLHHLTCFCVYMMY